MLVFQKQRIIVHVIQYPSSYKIQSTTYSPKNATHLHITFKTFSTTIFQFSPNFGSNFFIRLTFYFKTLSTTFQRQTSQLATRPNPFNVWIVWATAQLGPHVGIRTKVLQLLFSSHSNPQGSTFNQKPQTRLLKPKMFAIPLFCSVSEVYCWKPNYDGVSGWRGGFT